MLPLKDDSLAPPMKWIDGILKGGVLEEMSNRSTSQI